MWPSVTVLKPTEREVMGSDLELMSVEDLLAGKTSPTARDSRVVWLQTLWRRIDDCEGGWAFLSYRDDEGIWHDMPLPYRTWRYMRFEIPNDGETVYFCPNLFKTNRRKERIHKEDSKYENVHGPHNWLYADLDEVNPGVTPKPFCAWETSPGRYQAMWALAPNMGTKAHQALNQKLTYSLGADKNGWNVTKVLRLPDTISLKYEEPFSVRMLWDLNSREGIVRPRKLWQAIKHVPTPRDVVTRLPTLEIPDGMTKSAVIAKHRKRLSPTALKLLRAPMAKGDRSAVLWKLDRLLLEAGVPPEEVLVAVRSTVWNKYRGQSRELSQLWREIHKAQAQAEKRGEEDKSRASKVTREKPPKDGIIPLQDFIWQRHKTPGWLVEGIWSDNAHGFIVGEEKTFKSFLSADLAVSVATGTPFLNEFTVPKQGKVLMLSDHGENRPAALQDRLRKILYSRGLLGGISVSSNGGIEINDPTLGIPLLLSSKPHFDFSNSEDMGWLEGVIKRERPQLVIFDPLYLMLGGRDEKKSEDIGTILQELMRLKVEYDSGILILHHYRKQDPKNPTKGSQRISGTGYFGRWFQSAVFIESTEDPYVVELSTRHRDAPPTGGLTLTFEVSEMGELDYRVRISRSGDVRGRLGMLVEDAGEIPIGRLSEILGKSPKTVRKLAERSGFKVVLGQASERGGRPPLVVKVES